jgi:hypothetical protein
MNTAPRGGESSSMIPSYLETRRSNDESDTATTAETRAYPLNQQLSKKVDETIAPSSLSLFIKKTEEPIGPSTLKLLSLPGSNDVICGRGNIAFNHPGNCFLRSLADKQSSNYANAKTKRQRSVIVSEIIRGARERGNGFMKQSSTSGNWAEVGDTLAREKVGQLLRNSLSTQYRSSSKAKLSRRRRVSRKVFDQIQQVLQSNRLVCQIMYKMRSDVVRGRDSFLIQSDEEVMEIFDDANKRLLEVMKSDVSLVVRYQHVLFSAESGERRAPPNLMQAVEEHSGTAPMLVD